MFPFAARLRLRKIYLLVFLVTFSLGFCYGFLSGKFRVFPHDVLRDVLSSLVRGASDLTRSLSQSEIYPAVSLIVFSLPPGGGFEGNAREEDELGRVFDVVAADMDLDGDLDLFVNRHHLAPSELFENVRGVFHRINRPGSDRSGFFDDENVLDWSLIADEREMLAGLHDDGPGGVHVWHDRDRLGGHWRFLVKRDRRFPRAHRFSLRFNCPVAEVVGLEESEYEKLGDFELAFSFEKDDAARSFGVKLEDSLTARVKIALLTLEGDSLALFVGRNRDRAHSSSVVVWKHDPHGVAWVQAQGSPQPELFLTEGAMRGLLVPPHAPKCNRLYLWQGRDDALYRMVDEEIVRPDYGRGRKVEWVDVDNDGVNELYLGNRLTPNALLVRRRETGAYDDLASKLGLAFVSGEVSAWLDWDDDGWQDLVFVAHDRLALARNIDGSHFTILDGERVGLVLAPDPGRFFDVRTIHVLDFDNDGSLDLWISGWGRRAANHLFRRSGRGFVEVTEEVGLASVSNTRLLLVFDADNDGFIDALSIGRESVLLKNEQGSRFEPGQFNLSLGDERIEGATSGDFNGDGRIDVLCVSRENYYLGINRTDGDNTFLNVRLGPAAHEPIGALVKAYFADGRVQTQRYGSSANSTYSQALRSLHFGVENDNPLSAVGIRWPGTAEERTYSIEPGQNELRADPGSLARSDLPRP